ncbi:ABC transporter permease, partial [Acinetobacter baumannii]
RAVFRGLARILAHPLGRIGAILVGTVVLLALVAPFITHYDPLAQVLTHRLLPPGPSHVFGTDTLGRDVFARVVFGARPSLTIVLVSLVIIAP